MKKFITLLAISLAVMTVSPDVWAKKRKSRRRKKFAKSGSEQKKSEWQQRKEAMTPEQLKDVIEENHRLKTQQAALTNEGNPNQEELERLRKLREKINELRREKGLAESDDDFNLDDLFVQEQNNTSQDKTTPGELGKSDWAIDENGKPYLRGLSFKVQIGAYKKHDLSQVLENSQSLEAFEQETVDGLNIFTIRHFRNYWKANTFKKEVRALGIKDAYVICFVDGKRVALKSVLSKIRTQAK